PSPLRPRLPGDLARDTPAGRGRRAGRRRRSSPGTARRPPGRAADGLLLLPERLGRGADVLRRRQTRAGRTSRLARTFGRSLPSGAGDAEETSGESTEWEG